MPNTMTKENMIDLPNMSLNWKSLTLNLPITSKTKTKLTSLKKTGQIKVASLTPNQTMLLEESPIKSIQRHLKSKVIKNKSMLAICATKSLQLNKYNMIKESPTLKESTIK